ncbi:MAG: PadR family transcriptional regulator [Thaumarchaeota archaeon]|nr:PadR family transcriptional regulator [Nitrososphaerota archaeon]
MKDDNQDDESGKHGSRRNRLQKKLEELHQRRQLQHLQELQRMQFGQRGFLRPQVLELFEEQPMNGVDIMNKLQEMSRGWYRPSPGSIYPLLEQLEREGMIAKNREGKFELTPEFAKKSGVADDVASALSALESNASYLEDIQRADAARLQKCTDRIEKLARRFEALNGATQSGRGQ